MTWGELKHWLEANGVTDDLEVDFIEIQAPDHAEDLIVAVDEGTQTFSVID